MVVSKRCKICAVIDGTNVSINGEYFGKQIPDLIFKICGIEVDPRKATGALICQSCIIQLLHTDIIIEKLRNTMTRLKKNVKLRTPSNELKQSNLSKLANENEEQQQGGTNESIVQTPVKEAERNTKTPKKLVRRKSVCPTAKPADVFDTNGKSEESPICVNGTKFQKFADDIPIAKDSPAKTVKRKSTTSTSEVAHSSLANDHVNSTNEKRLKKNVVAVSEKPAMDLSLDEQYADKTNNETCIMESEENVRNCILCGKMFNSKRTLRDHIETSHMGERLKACPHCSSEFRSQQKYESHVFSEKCKSSNHACQFLNCNKRFKTVHKMEMHMQLKHSSQDEL